MAADVVLSVVETDLRLLAAEAKKAEGPMTNLMGILHHSDLPAVKDATERALQKIRSVEHGGLSSVQQALEILAPFVRACETKYAKLACIAISAFQKLLANDAVSIRGRCEIIKALQAAERLTDENVKLRILQASLTIIQSPSFADEEDAIKQLLSIAFRLYVNNKSNFTVHSTAAATIRQAVALVFDHSLLPSRTPAVSSTPTAGSPAVGSSPVPALSNPVGSVHSPSGANSPGPAPQLNGPGLAGIAPGSAAAAAVVVGTTANADGVRGPGREVVPVLLMEEMMGWLGAREGKELGWVQLQQRGSTRFDRTFLLEMLEAVLLQRSAAIHRLQGLVQCVKARVAPAIQGLLESACDRLVDPNDSVDCRLVVRCAAALVRRYHDLAPDRVAAMVARLAETAGSVGRPGASQRWQRFMVLQAMRPLVADPSLLYRLHHLSLPTEKQSAAGSSAALVGSGKPTGAASGATETANGDAGTGNCSGGPGGVVPLVVQCLRDALRWYVRTVIETPEDDVVAALGNLYYQRAQGARDSVQETEAFGTNLAHGSEVVIAHLALECVLGMVGATEALTDVVVVPAEPGMPSPKLITRDTPDVRCAAVAGLVSELWRCVLAVSNTLLARATHEVLVGLLVRGLQGITYSAGALGVIDARDALLHALCAHTLLPPGEDDVAALAASTTGGGGGGTGGVTGLLSDDRSVGSSGRRLAVAAAPVSTGSAAATGSGSGAPSPAPGFLTALLVERAASSVRVVLTPRNTAALRSLFNLAHRLADGLGSCGWLYVVDAVNALDRILASPHTTTAAYLPEMSGGGETVGMLQPMASALMPISGPGGTGTAAGGGATAAATGGGAAAGGSAAAAAAVASSVAAAAAAGDGGADDSSTTAQRELRILASAADQLFENTHHMSPEAVVSLLSALADISHRTLMGLGLLAGGGVAGSPAGGGGGAAAAAAPPALHRSASMGGSSLATVSAAAVAAVAAPVVTAGAGGSVLSPGAAATAGASTTPGLVRLCALNRMVDTLLHNLWRVQDLWGIFLAHVLEVLASNNVQVRAAAVDALDRTITGALNTDLHVPDKFTSPLPALEDALSPSPAAIAATAAAAAAARKALMPALASYSLAPGPAAAAGLVTSPSGTPGSRRTSRDAGFGAGAAAGMAMSSTPVPIPQGPLPPFAGRGGSGAVGGGGGASLSYASVGSPLATSTAATLPLPPTARHVSGGGGGGTSAVGLAHPSSDLSANHALFPLGLPHPPPPNSLSSSPATAATTVASPFAQSLTTATVAAGAASSPLVANRGVQQSAQREDVQHMLLVALDSLYREGGRSPDVRHGLLRIALHVLQHHGDCLTRGWVPLLRLLDAVPRAGQGPADVRLGFQVVELLATDYLASSLPKEHVAKALDVIAKFATQDTVLNVALSSITLLWNVTDHLARSRGTFSKATSTQHLALQGQSQQPQQPQTTTATTAPPATPTATAAAAASPVVPPSFGPSGGSSAFGISLYGNDAAAQAGSEKQMSPAFAAALSFARGVPSLPSASSPERSPWAHVQQSQPQSQQQQQQPISSSALAAGASGGGGGGSYQLHDLDEAESIAMLMIAFRSLKALSMDPRPEARNAAVRTLFLAAGSHGGKFPGATWHELFWSLLFDLLLTIHRVCATSSVAEAAAVELGREKGGRPVVMLVHHSRNSEQKQWDETLVLALGGAAKVMRSYMAVLSELDVWAQAWEQLMQLLGELLATGRKALCLASTSLLTTVLQAHGSGPLVSRTMWQHLLAALDRGVNAMAAPNTSAPLQARAELLTCITTLSSQLLLLRCQPPSLGATTAATTAAAAADSGDGASSSLLDPEHLLVILRWLDRFARYPVGADDPSSIHFTTIGPIQKAVLTALTALPPAAAAAGVWPAVLGVLCNMLRPFTTLALRQFAQQAATLQQLRKASSTATAHWAISSTAEGPLPASGPPPPPLQPITSVPSATATAAPVPSPLDPMASYASGGITSANSSREPSVHCTDAASAAAAAPPPSTATTAAAITTTAAAGAGAPAAPAATGAAAPAAPAAAGAAAAGAAAAAAAAASSSSGSAAWLAFATSSEAMEARALSPLWMARVVELLAAWYRDNVSWQVRVATFPLLVGAMSECMACRHLLPQPSQATCNTRAPNTQHQQQVQSPTLPQPQLQLGGDVGEVQALEELWRTAARGFMTVVQSGLPSINICCVQGQQTHQHVLVPQSTWPALARAFQMLFLASSLPPLQQPPPEVQHALTLAVAASGGGGGGGSSSSSSGATAVSVRHLSASAEPPPPSAAAVTLPIPSPSPEQVATDLEITIAVLDCLSDAVLSSCQHAPVEVRRALIGVLDAGAASAVVLSAAGISSSDMATIESALPPTSRLSHVCLNKLYVLCSRGQDAPGSELDGRAPSQLPGGSTRAQLEVAQLALPVFVTRCEAVLQDYARADQRARSASSAAGDATASGPVAAGAVVAAAINDNGDAGLDGPVASHALTLTPLRTGAVPTSLYDKARHVLELLQQLHVVPPVSDSLLPYRPHLRFWLDVMRAVRWQAAMPTPAMAAGAASALHSIPSFGGSSGLTGSGMLQSPPVLSRCSSSGFELPSPAVTGATSGGGGSATGSELSFSSAAVPPPGRPAAASSSFFSKTYSSTTALLSSAMGAATGGGSTPASVAPLTPPTRPSGSGSGGGTSAATAGQAAEQRTPHAALPRSMAAALTASAGSGSVSGGTAGGLQLTGSSLWAKEQPHLPALYGVLCECISSSDPVVRAAVQSMLAALGGGLGLCAALSPPPSLW